LDHRRAALSSLGEHLRGDVDQRHVVPLGQGRREAAVATSDVEDTQPGAVDPVQHRLPLALVEVVERIGRNLGAEVPAVALAKVAAGRALVERLELSDDRVHVVGAGLLPGRVDGPRSEEHTSELQSLAYLVCRLLLEKKKKTLV